MTIQFDPVLAALRVDLERRGMVVVPHGNHLCVRLPFLASVRVWRDGDALRCVPQLGPMARGRGVLTALAPLGAAGAGLLLLGPTAPLLAAACGAAIVALGGAFAGIIADGCMTRVTVVWETRGLHGMRAAYGGSAQSALPAPAAARQIEPQCSPDISPSPSPPGERLPASRSRSTSPPRG
jgi:hypothetical protein